MTDPTVTSIMSSQSSKISVSERPWKMHSQEAYDHHDSAFLFQYLSMMIQQINAVTIKGTPVMQNPLKMTFSHFSKFVSAF